MNVLEKILEEIETEKGKQCEVCKDMVNTPGYRLYEKTVSMIEGIIRSHMLEKEKVSSAEIISRNIDGKPYYEIKFKKVGEDHYTVGYSSYKLDYVVNWLNEYFEFYGEVKASVNVAKNTNVPSNDEIEPVSEEFLKDCAETAAKYKRNDDSWIPVEDGLPEEKGWYQCTCSDKDIWNEGIVRDLYYYPEIKEFVDNIRYENNGLKNIEKYYWTKYVTAWQPLPEPYRHKDIPTAKNTQQEMEDFWRDK